MPSLPFKRKSTPSRQVTGTTYATQGAVDVKGTAATLSEIGSALAGRVHDPILQFASAQSADQTYSKMVRADASVRISLRAGKSPVLGADYYFEPCDESPEAALNAALAEYNLLHGMTTPWLKTLEQILKMYEKGWSLFEPVWEIREWTPPPGIGGVQLPNRKRFTMIRKLAVRPVSTVSKINYDDNGGPISFEQNAIRGDGKVNRVTIPIQKAVAFTFDQDGGDLTGNSILRSAYQHWYYKDHLYKIDAVQKERHGIGIPDVELQPGYSQTDKEIAEELASNLRTNEKAHVVRTPFIHIGFIELSGNPVDALQSATHHDTMIMKNIMVQFLNVGEGTGRATAATGMDMFLKAMKYVAQSICDNINMYVIPQLIAYNFKSDKFPELKVKNIGETKDLQMWAAAIANLINKGGIQVDDDFEQWVRAQVDAPKRTSPYKEKQEQQPAPPNGKGATSGYVGKSPSSAA